MTSNLGSEEIRAASPQLHKLVAETEDRHERYLKAIGEFNKELYDLSCAEKVAQEGRISWTDQSDRGFLAIE